jgi:hypothetical protein
MKTKPRLADGLEPIKLATHYRPPAASHPAPADGDMEQFVVKGNATLFPDWGSAKQEAVGPVPNGGGSTPLGGPSQSVSPSAGALQ